MNHNKHEYAMSTKRTKELKKVIQSTKREISTVRGRIFTEVFSQNKGKPLVVKRALAYQTLSENLPINIYDNELLKGKGIDAEETRCAAKGDDFCEFVMKRSD